MVFLIYGLIVLALIIIFAGLKIIDQYEKGVVLTLGKFSSIRSAGLTYIVPIIQRIVVVDLRIRTIDIEKQQVMTKDNVPVNVNGVVFFKVAKVDDAILKIQDYGYSLAQYAQTALRDVIGGMSLDNVLTERQKIGEEIRKRAVIIKSEGDRDAAKNLAAAATVMAKSKGAMQLRTLQTLDGLGPTASNTVVMALPVEVMEFFQKLTKKE